MSMTTGSPYMILSDGKTIALMVNSENIIINKAKLYSFNVTVEPEPTDCCAYGFKSYRPQRTILSLEFVSTEQPISINEIDNTDFRFAKDMTVRELFKSSIDKIKKRTKGEANGRL